MQLYSTKIGGSIPSEIGLLSKLQVLSLNSCNFSGLMPPEIGKLNSLERLDVSMNNLTGAIPPEFGNLSSITFLDLSDNNLNGCFHPHLLNICPLSNTSNINEGNNFSAQWEEFCVDSSGNCFEVCNASDFQSLQELFDSTNGSGWSNNSGWLSDCDPCGYLSGNPWFGIECDQQKLRVEKLDLSGNGLLGNILIDWNNLGNLKHINLSNNQLTEDIPKDLSYLYFLDSIALHKNNFIGCYHLSLIKLCSKAIEPFDFGNPGLSSWNQFCVNGSGFCISCQDSEVEWLGIIDDQWNKPRNWSQGCIPDVNDIVIIGSNSHVKIRPSF